MKRVLVAALMNLMSPAVCWAGSPYAYITATTYKTVKTVEKTPKGWRPVDRKETSSQWFTSGTVIGHYENGDGLILTCAHGKPKGSELKIEFRDQRGSFGTGKIVSVDEEHDLCLIRSWVGKANVIDVAAAEPRRGDRVHVIGFGHQKYNARFGKVAYVRNGIIFSKMDSLHGDSGGAVLNEDGELCGVIKATTARDKNKPADVGNENDSISVATSAILEFLKESDHWNSGRRD